MLIVDRSTCILYHNILRLDYYSNPNPDFRGLVGGVHTVAYIYEASLHEL